MLLKYRIYALTKWLLGREMKSACTERHDVTTRADGFTEETKSKPSLSGGPYVPWIASRFVVRECGRCLLLDCYTLKTATETINWEMLYNMEHSRLCHKCRVWHSSKDVDF